MSAVMPAALWVKSSAYSKFTVTKPTCWCLLGMISTMLTMLMLCFHCMVWLSSSWQVLVAATLLVLVLHCSWRPLSVGGILQLTVTAMMGETTVTSSSTRRNTKETGTMEYILACLRCFETLSSGNKDRNVCTSSAEHCGFTAAIFMPESSE